MSIESQLMIFVRLQLEETWTAPLQLNADTLHRFPQKSTTAEGLEGLNFFFKTLKKVSEVRRKLWLKTQIQEELSIQM